MSKELAARALTIAGVLVGVGGYLSQPENLATLSASSAHYVAAVGAVAYVVGQALEHYLTRQQVTANAKAIATATGVVPPKT